MSYDLEERVRRTLADEVRDVDPDPAIWATVQTRIRRRAVARWSATGLAAAAVVAVAVLVIPGLVTGTRVDLSPADPGAGSRGVPGLVHTDGERIVVADGAGETVVAELAEAAAGQAIRRLAVRPGSTADDLAVAYLVTGPDCQNADMRWVMVDGDGTRSGFLDEGGGYCLTDPVWSPDGAAVAWVRRQPPDDIFGFDAPASAGGDVHLLIMRAWLDDGPDIDEPHGNNQFSYLDLSLLEDGQPPIRALRATAWDWTDGQGALHLSATHAGGPVRAASIGPISRPEGPHDQIQVPVQPQPTDDPNGPGEYPSALVEPRPPRGDARVLVTAERHNGTGTDEDPRFALILQLDGTVWLQRTTGRDGHSRMVPHDVLDAEQADAGDVWLSASGDVAVLGVDGNAWVASWVDDPHSEPEALSGVVHADVLGVPRADLPPTPTAAPRSPP